MRVAVVGHVEWVDFIPVRRLPVPGEVVNGHGAFTRAAGGGGVAAAILAEMGAEVDFFCALGRDAHGEATAAELTARAVHPHVQWTSVPTRRAVTLLEDGGERTIVTIGERLDPCGAASLEWERLDGADGVYFTAGDSGALDHARRARHLVATPRARHALESEGPAVDALVFSVGDKDESKWAARVAERARLLVVTDGPRGGSWSGQSEGTWAAAPLPGPRRDSYGCGDSFAAAFTYGLASGGSVAEAAALGARWGAEVLTRRGAP